MHLSLFLAEPMFQDIQIDQFPMVFGPIALSLISLLPFMPCWVRFYWLTLNNAYNAIQNQLSS